MQNSGYNFSEHINIAAEFGWNSANYDVRSVDESGDPVKFSGTLSTSKLFFNGTYNILPRALTPFVTGGFGWTFIDSNIPSGDTTCWWDPWWGYNCLTDWDTFAATEFPYNLGVGVRWNINRMLYTRASYNREFLDVKNVKLDFDMAILEFGVMF